MKYVFLFLLCLPFSAPAQSYFTLTPAGMVSGANMTDRYLDIEYPRESKAELYTKAVKVINGRYKPPEEKITLSQPDSITFQSVRRDYVKMKSGAVLDLFYTVTVEFRDEHIRFKEPYFTIGDGKTKGGRQKPSTVKDTGISSGIFSRDGKLLQVQAKHDLEKFFNDYLRNFKTDISLISE